MSLDKSGKCCCQVVVGGRVLSRVPCCCCCRCRDCRVVVVSLSLLFSKAKYETKQNGIRIDMMIKDTETYLTARGWVHHLSGWFISHLPIVVVVVVVRTL
jgi:hypothetical protein